MRYIFPDKIEKTLFLRLGISWLGILCIRNLVRWELCYLGTLLLGTLYMYPYYILYFLYFFLQHIHSYIHSPRVHSCFLIALREGLPGLPSRDANSGKPTHYFLSYAAPYLSYVAPSELRRTLLTIFTPVFLSHWRILHTVQCIRTVVVVGKGSKKTAHVLQCLLTMTTVSIYLQVRTCKPAIL